MNKIEINVLKELNKKGYENFPKYVTSTVKLGKPGIVMSMFGKSLAEHH